MTRVAHICGIHSVSIRLVAKRYIAASARAERIGAGRGGAGSGEAWRRPQLPTALTSTALDAVLAAAASGDQGQSGQGTGQKAKARNFKHLIPFQQACVSQKTESGKGKLA